MAYKNKEDQAKASKLWYERNQNLEKIALGESFNFQKISDKYEEKNYEQNVKRNLATLISQKLILRLSISQ